MATGHAIIEKELAVLIELYKNALINLKTIQIKPVK